MSDIYLKQIELHNDMVAPPKNSLKRLKNAKNSHNFKTTRQKYQILSKMPKIYNSLF
jgi:hypothetical protein